MSKIIEINRDFFKYCYDRGITGLTQYAIARFTESFCGSSPFNRDIFSTVMEAAYGGGFKVLENEDDCFKFSVNGSVHVFDRGQYKKNAICYPVENLDTFKAVLFFKDADGNCEKWVSEWEDQLPLRFTLAERDYYYNNYSVVKSFFEKYGYCKRWRTLVRDDAMAAYRENHEKYMLTVYDNEESWNEMITKYIRDKEAERLVRYHMEKLPKKRADALWKTLSESVGAPYTVTVKRNMNYSWTDEIAFTMDNGQACVFIINHIHNSALENIAERGSQVLNIVNEIAGITGSYLGMTSKTPGRKAWDETTCKISELNAVAKSVIEIFDEEGIPAVVKYSKDILNVNAWLGIKDYYLNLTFAPDRYPSRDNILRLTQLIYAFYDAIQEVKCKVLIK